MSDANLTSERVPKAAWVIAYLLSPAAPFVCLRVERAISTAHCMFGVAAALVAHLGLVSVLTYTNGDPLQFFIVLCLATSIFLIVFWQYFVGHSASLWSLAAEKQWRIAGRFFGSLLGVAVAIGIISFHLHRIATNAEPGAGPNGDPAASLGNLGVTEGPPSVS